MRRREVVAGVLAICVPGTRVGAQQPARVLRVGLLHGTSAEINEVLFTTMRDAMAARGYVEGRNVVFDAAYAAGRLERVPELARALVARRPDVIVSYTVEVTQAAAAATNAIPIVMVFGNDPILAGLTTSLGRPSRNVTGFSTVSEVMAPKRLDYLLQLAPRAQRLGFLYGDANGVFQRDATEPIARARGIVLIPIMVRELAGVVPTLAASALDALMVSADPITYPATPEIVEFTVARRLPAIFSDRQMALDGGLMALGYDVFENVRGTAEYVARILDGTPIASLPFQQPRRIIFTLNLRTARHAGIEVPPVLIAVADEVIE